MDSQYLFRFGTAIRNAMQMIRDRGYEVAPFAEDPYEISSQIYSAAIKKGISLGEASHQCFFRKGEKLSLWCADRNYDTIKYKERMISMDQMKLANDAISKDDAAVHILLLPHKQSPQAKKETCEAQIFLFTDMSIDLPRHKLICPHMLVSETEAKTILGSKLDIHDLPILPLLDPISKWYGFKKGSIIYIKNPTMSSFRIVK